MIKKEKANLKEIRDELYLNIGICFMFLAYFLSYIFIYYNVLKKQVIPIMALISAILCIIFSYLTERTARELRKKEQVEYLREVLTDIQENKARGK